MKLYPSLLSADLLNMQQAVQDVIDAGADGLHVDIMDRHYVPNLSLSPKIIQALKKQFPESFLDVHIMASPVDAILQECLEYGANQLSFHIETSLDPIKSIERLRAHDCRVGIALNPQDDISLLEPFWTRIDVVLVMGVVPGFGGQSFKPETLEKIKKLRQHIDKMQLPVAIEVDGGVNLATASAIQKAGADILVAGHAIFSTSSYTNTIRALKGLP